VKAFVQGVTAAAVGAISGAALILGRRLLVDLPTILIAVTAFAILQFKKIPEPLLIWPPGGGSAVVQGIVFRSSLEGKRICHVGS
jgi:chromate transporter